LNRAKGRELMTLLRDFSFEAVLLADVVSDARLPEETGMTYVENALIKARAAARVTGLRALADDSGLEVDALAGAPGIHSARYGGPELDDAGRIAHLLAAIANVPDAKRTARFRCVIALVETSGVERVVEGDVAGVIARAPHGRGGFGYDPVFFYPPLARTFAEMTPEEKHRVDHRGAAVRALARALA
jgi:XTP/dITP diphosphohydrolase